MLVNFDNYIFRFINETCHNAVLDIIMPRLTGLGSGQLLFVIAVILLFFKRKDIKITGILLMAALACSYQVVHFLKMSFSRPRPFITLEAVNVLIEQKGFSFPSAHAAMAFTAAVILTKCLKKGYIFFAIAATVAITRIYIGVHYPSDVIVGSLLGCLIGYALINISSRSSLYNK